MPIKNEEGTSQADVPTIAKDENGEDYSMDDIVIKVEDVASIMTVTKKEEGTDTGEDVLAAIQEEDAAAQAPGGPPPGYMRLQGKSSHSICYSIHFPALTPVSRFRRFAPLLAGHHYRRYASVSARSRPCRYDRLGVLPPPYVPSFLLLYLKGNSNPRLPVTTILNHLLFVYKDDENPRESVWNFYEVWLVANPITHEDSPFRSFFTADALFLQ